MNRQQMETHLALLGWFVVDTPNPYLAHSDGRWVSYSLSKTEITTAGRDDSGELRESIAGAFGLLSDARLDSYVNRLIREGWL